MKDRELQIDRSCQVLYSKPCKNEILAKITLHYPEVEREAVWEQVQLRYAELLSDWRTDLGGKKNFHNGVSGCRCDYAICGDKDPYVKEHPEYRDENGYRRNRECSYR